MAEQKPPAFEFYSKITKGTVWRHKETECWLIRENGQVFYTAKSQQNRITDEYQDSIRIFEPTKVGPPNPTSEPSVQPEEPIFSPGSVREPLPGKEDSSED